MKMIAISGDLAAGAMSDVATIITVTKKQATLILNTQNASGAFLDELEKLEETYKSPLDVPKKERENLTMLRNKVKALQEQIEWSSVFTSKHHFRTTWEILGA